MIERNRRIVATGFGDAEVLRLVEEPVPVPGPGEVLVRVEAAGVAMGDVMRRKGAFPALPELPFTPGYDVVGRTVPGGQRVAVLFNGTGGYSRYIRVRAEEAVPVPEEVDPHVAVSLVLNYVTAYQLLCRAIPQAGRQRILIHGAAGGVGSAVLELGRLFGHEMIGTATAAKLPVVEAYGAMGVDYRSEDFVTAVRRRYPDGIDAVLDPIGGDNWRRSALTLRQGGALVAFGTTSMLNNEPESQAAARLKEDWATLAKGEWGVEGVTTSMYSITGWKYAHPDWFRADLGVLFGLLTEGRIRPRVHATLPLAQAGEAHGLLERSEAIGKVTLDCHEHRKGS